MTENPNVPIAPLGVGSLISESFSLFFSRIVTMFKIIFVPILLLAAVGAWASGPALIASFGMLTGNFDPELMALLENPGFFASYILPLIGVVVSSVVSGAVILAAYDSKLGRAINIPAYINRTLGFIFPIIVLSIAFAIIMYIGLFLLIIPGIYIAARFSVLVPAIIVDGAGWSGMGRAQELTKEYRWPIVGALILIALALIAVSLVFAGLVYLAYSLTGLVGYVLVLTVGNTLTTGIIGCFSALLFARLRELKDGVGMTDIATVFE